MSEPELGFGVPPAAKPSQPAGIPVIGLGTDDKQPFPKRTRYTNEELRALNSLGVSPDEELPANFTEIVAQALALPMPPPVPPGTPPLAPPKPVSFDNVSPEQQAQIRAAMFLALENEKQLQAKQQQQLEILSLDPSVQKAIRVADEAANIPVEADDPERDTPSGSLPAEQRNCPHCGYPQELPYEVKPTENDKIVFQASVLGDIPFEKTYAILGGRLEVTFRSLTQAELDALFADGFIRRQSGELPTQDDFWEIVNRNQFYLQLVKISGPGRLTSFPEGLSPKTNPGKKSYWCEDCEGGAVRKLEEDVHTKVRDETTFRILRQQCNEFNRLRAHLEAMAERPDFWPATASP